ncbi:Uncharacterised protein [Mycobacteroides abscessus subsp. abscessus]|nr:Uncharacterised protein [Mycobacteroides abscessus subsp. abscessus]
MRGPNHIVSGPNHLLRQRLHALHDRYRLEHVVGLDQQVIHAVPLKGHQMRLARATHAEHERNSGVLERFATRARNRLNPRNTRDCLHSPGQFVQNQKVDRIAHIVIGLDQQNVRCHHQ